MNVDITWTAVPGATATEMFNLMFSSGELPDMFFGGLSPSTATVYGGQGFLLPLNDEWGANIQYLFSINDQLKGMLTSPDGNIYGLPYYIGQSKTHTAAPGKLLLNMTWLENLGLEVPSTTDELYEVLKAFKEQDANGNGDPTDEIPLSSAGDARIGSYIMQAFTYLGFQNVAPQYLYLEDGKVTTSFAQEGWREGLAYLNKLYAEGLYDPESFVNNTASMKMLTGNENGTRLGATEHYAWSGVADLSLVDVCEQYEFIEPLKNAAGERVTSGAKASLPINCAISADTAYPEVCFRYADALLTNPLSSAESLTGLVGPEGEAWRWAEEGELAADGVTPAVWTRLYTWGQPNNLNFHETSLIRYEPDEYSFSMVSNSAVSTTFNMSPHLTNGTIDLYLPYAQYKTLPPIIQFTEEEIQELTQLELDIYIYISEMKAAFMTGTKSTESDWDAYLAELENIGLSRYLEMYQIAYDRQIGA